MPFLINQAFNLNSKESIPRVALKLHERESFKAFRVGCSKHIHFPPPLSVFFFLGFCLLLTDLLSHFSTLYLLVFDLSSAGPKSRPTLSFCSNTDTPVSETDSRL